jgi:hypothetical protein
VITEEMPLNIITDFMQLLEEYNEMEGHLLHSATATAIAMCCTV